MKDDEVEEVSRWMRIGQSLLPKQMNNLGIHRRKRVKISSKEQSVWYKFVFGILLSIVIYEFCQLLLPALKMTPERVETCQQINICSQESLQSLVLQNYLHTNLLPQVWHLNPVVGPRKFLQRFGLVFTLLSQTRNPFKTSSISN